MRTAPRLAIGLVLAAVALSGYAGEEEEGLPASAGITPLALGVFYELVDVYAHVQFPGPAYDVVGLRVNLVSGQHRSVTGFRSV